MQKNEFELNVSQGDGASLRCHLQAVYRQTGIVPDRLEPLPCPESLVYIWRDFLDLHSGRQSGGFGVNALSYTEIDAWSRLTGLGITPNELSIIRQLDNIYMAHQAQQQAKK